MSLESSLVKLSSTSQFLTRSGSGLIVGRLLSLVLALTGILHACFILS
jgi:hypothetical protein